MSNKFIVYQESGVKEYWIISPIEKTLTNYILREDGLFSANKPFIEDDLFTSAILPGFEMKVGNIFE